MHAQGEITAKAVKAKFMAPRDWDYERETGNLQNA